MAPIPEVIAWDYQFAPNAQKSRNYLHATNTPFTICEQPFVLPRPILTNLGITYRRVPVLSIGKDVFCDNVSFIESLQQLLEKEGGGLRRGPADKAFDAWGYRSFWLALPCVPADLVTPALAKDRETLFPVFSRADFAQLRPNSLSELRAMMSVAEHEFLSKGGPWISGEMSPGLADIYAMWIIKWALQTLDIQREPGLGKEDFPGVYRWIESVKAHDEAAEKGLKISEEEARKRIFGAGHALPDIGVDATDPLQLKAGEEVAVTATDAQPNTHPQIGKLVGLNQSKSVLQLDNGLRVHFPRVGYTLNKATAENMANGQ